MKNIIRAEWIKSRHSFSAKIIFVFPFLVSLLAVISLNKGTDGSLNFIQSGGYNWWYTILFPFVYIILCITNISREKKQTYFNIFSLPIKKSKIWLGKILAIIGQMVLCNIILLVFFTIVSFIFGGQYTLITNILAFSVLIICVIWQIPVILFLTTYFKTILPSILFLFINIFCSSQDIAGGRFWFIPFAIPSRLMAAIVHINPNGVLLDENSPLNNIGVILPGLAICIVLFILFSTITANWFNKRGG